MQKYIGIKTGIIQYVTSAAADRHSVSPAPPAPPHFPLAGLRDDFLLTGGGGGTDSAAGTLGEIERERERVTGPVEPAS